MTPEITAFIYRLPVRWGEFLAGTGISIGHTLAMSGIVLPCRCLDLPRVDDGGAVDV